jgi:FKBP-type peptidyl-prolyl cis-trans isomerase FkpA
MKFKHFYYFLFIIIIGLVPACTSSDPCAANTKVAPDAEQQTLAAYISSSGVSAIKNANGFYYTIVNAGDANAKPSTCSTIVINYTGLLIDGTVFEVNNNTTFNLGSLIAGWQQAIPLIGKGGTIKMYLPPSLAYGSEAQAGIPANSILIFEVELLNVK